MANITHERAVEILEYVLEEFIEGLYELSFDEKKNQVTVENKSVNLKHSWVLSEPRLTEVLLYCDAHAFAALIIRNTESTDSSRRLPASVSSMIRSNKMKRGQASKVRKPIDADDIAGYYYSKPISKSKLVAKLGYMKHA